MRLITLILLSALLAGCPVILQGLLKNESGHIITHRTDWKPYDDDISEGETRKIRLISPGACLEFKMNEKSRYFVVPVPPAEAQVSGYWYATYSVVVESDGVYYTGNNIEPVQFEEVSTCGT